jgi:hypothetical protein
MPLAPKHVHCRIFRLGPEKVVTADGGYIDYPVYQLLHIKREYHNVTFYTSV